MFGYRVVRLISKESAGQRELQDPRVQQAIREQLRDRREQLLKAAYYEVIRDEAKVENYFAEDILKKAGNEVARQQRQMRFSKSFFRARDFGRAILSTAASPSPAPNP